jgi:hypothetical protein
VKRCRREDKLFYLWLFNDSMVYGEERSFAPGTFNFHHQYMLKETKIKEAFYANEDQQQLPGVQPLVFSTGGLPRGGSAARCCCC